VALERVTPNKYRSKITNFTTHKTPKAASDAAITTPVWITLEPVTRGAVSAATPTNHVETTSPAIAMPQKGMTSLISRARPDRPQVHLRWSVYEVTPPARNATRFEASAGHRATPKQTARTDCPTSTDADEARR
jgi:hypothetical protein